MRNLRRTLAAALLLPVVVPAVAGWAQTAGAAPPRGAKTTPRPIHVVQVTGPIDPVNADLVTSALARAARRKAEVVILALDSRGALDSNARRVWRAVAAAKVPVAVWVGPAGATARGAAAFVLQAATVAAVAPGTTAGPALPIDLDGSGRSERLAAELRTLAARHQRSEDVAEDLALHDLRVDLVEPTLGSLIVALDGRPIATAAGPKTLKTARVVTTKGGPRRAPIGPVSFVKLGLGPRLEHALVGPGVAWLFFVLGLCLIVFEFYAASVGVAGAVGALALVAALFGFSHLPVHIWAVALTAVAIAAFAVDVQAATTGIWTIFGTIGMFVGGIFFYGGTGDLDLAWWHVLLLTIGVVLFFVGGMASVVRARFSTPTLGRESMIGEMGEAHAAVAPDGIVLVRGAMWRARTNRATPIAPGDPIRVVAVDGVVLEVEPEVGGARDAHH
jgi:membrane-bound serine protease (ClpP class)